MKSSIIYQAQNKDYTSNDLISLFKREWRARGCKLKDIEELALYVKLEEQKAYFVINGDTEGSFLLY